MTQLKADKLDQDEIDSINLPIDVLDAKFLIVNLTFLFTIISIVYEYQ